MRNYLLLLPFVSFTVSYGQFFSTMDLFFNQHVTSEGEVKYKDVSENELQLITNLIATYPIENTTENERKAFYINAYNFLVIKQIIDNGIPASVQEIPGFFDNKIFVVANEKISLNRIEKEKLFKEYKDPLLHFVLICGAKGCPPIAPFAFTPDNVEAKLKERTIKAINSESFIVRLEKNVSLSKIFEWYATDFGTNNKEVIQFINVYATNKIEEDANITYYTYDWSVNQLEDEQSGERASEKKATNDNRYVVSAAIPKGESELKIFNNLYTQSIGTSSTFGSRSNFFSTTTSYLYGLSSRFNLGVEMRYRKVTNVALPSSPFAVLSANRTNTSSIRSGITGIGPKIRLAPIKQWSHFSLQSTLLIPFVDSQEGTVNKPFIDWNKSTWFTQFFYDMDLGSYFSLFTEIDFVMEDIGIDSKEDLNRISTPFTAIISYFPIRNLTIYGLTSYSPFYQKSYDYFYQYGLGTKYQFTKAFELELLYTNFNNKYLSSVDNGKAATYNIGMRVSF